VIVSVKGWEAVAVDLCDLASIVIWSAPTVLAFLGVFDRTPCWTV
jgi:hypothetical protein